jgi:lycopene cyclase domain-containing protein
MEVICEGIAMAQFHYLLVLLFIACCAVAVSIAFKIRITRFWRNFLLTDLSILVIYLIWDYWAIRKNNWSFDGNQILGIYLFGIIPIEEVLFFIIVPLMTVIVYVTLIKILKFLKEKR